MMSRMLLLFAVIALVLSSTSVQAKDEACTYGVNCYCDRVKNPSDSLYDPKALFCEDFENPSFNDGGPGWTASYPGIVDGCMESRTAYPRGVEGTCPTCCINIVQESKCEASGENDCVFQGSQAMGHRLPPGRTGGIVGDGGKAVWPTTRTFGVTYLVRYSSNYVDPSVAQKTNEFGDGRHCILGCSTHNAGRNVPFSASLFSNFQNGKTGFDIGGSVVKGQIAKLDIGWAVGPNVSDYEWRNTHGPGKWMCHQMHWKNWGTSNATLRFWINGNVVIHVTNMNMAGNLSADSEGVNKFVWNNYYNGGYPGSTIAYRYEDNIHVTGGDEPIPCAAVGFGDVPSDTVPPATPKNLRISTSGASQ